MSWLSDVVGGLVGSLADGAVKNYLTGLLRLDANKAAVVKTHEGDLCVCPLPNQARSPWLVPFKGDDGRLYLVRVAAVVTETVLAAPDGKNPRPGYVSRTFAAELLPPEPSGELGPSLN